MGFLQMENFLKKNIPEGGNREQRQREGACGAKCDGKAQVQST